MLVLIEFRFLQGATSYDGLQGQFSINHLNDFSILLFEVGCHHGMHGNHLRHSLCQTVCPHGEPKQRRKIVDSLRRILHAFEVDTLLRCGEWSGSLYPTLARALFCVALFSILSRQKGSKNLILNTPQRTAFHQSLGIQTHLEAFLYGHGHLDGRERCETKQTEIRVRSDGTDAHNLREDVMDLLFQYIQRSRLLHLLCHHCLLSFR